jgi:hypothetical protein
LRRLAFLLAAVPLLLTSCPYVSCARKAPPTAFLAGPYEVAARRIDRCTFELTDGLAQGPFPRSQNGFYAIAANGFPQSWQEVSYDAGTPTFTVHGRECDRGIARIDVTYYQWMRTMNE